MIESNEIYSIGLQQNEAKTKTGISQTHGTPEMIMYANCR